MTRLAAPTDDPRPGGTATAAPPPTLGGAVAVDAERLALLRRGMEEAGLDGIVCTLSEQVLALTGYWSMNGTCVALVAREGDPLLLVPSGEEERAQVSGWPLRVYPFGRLVDPPFDAAVTPLLRDAAAELGLRGARIGVEFEPAFLVPSFTAHEVTVGTAEVRRVVTEALAPRELVDATALLRRVRAIKTAREQAAIRRAAAAADAGLRAFRELTVPGSRDVDVALGVEAAVTRAVADANHGRARAWAYVISGPQIAQAYLPFQVTSPRRMSVGELVLLELAVVVEGYWQDVSRTHAVGEATADQRAAAAAVNGAWRAAVAAAKPGATGGEVDRAARVVLEDAGYGEAYLHGTGHGVGMAFHEPYPLLVPGHESVLEAGMVIAIEPGVYLPGFGGLRNEDDCLVTADGAISLNQDDHSVEAA